MAGHTLGLPTHFQFQIEVDSCPVTQKPLISHLQTRGCTLFSAVLSSLLLLGETPLPLLLPSCPFSLPAYLPTSLSSAHSDFWFPFWFA